MTVWHGQEGVGWVNFLCILMTCAPAVPLSAEFDLLPGHSSGQACLQDLQRSKVGQVMPEEDNR